MEALLCRSVQRWRFVALVVWAAFTVGCGSASNVAATQPAVTAANLSHSATTPAALGDWTPLPYGAQFLPSVPAFQTIKAPTGAKAAHLYALDARSDGKVVYQIAVQFASEKPLVVNMTEPWNDNRPMVEWLNGKQALVGGRYLYDAALWRRRDLAPLLKQALGDEAGALVSWAAAADAKGGRVVLLAQLPTKIEGFTFDPAADAPQPAFTTPAVQAPAAFALRAFATGDGGVLFSLPTAAGAAIAHWDGQRVRRLASGLDVDSVSPDGSLLTAWSSQGEEQLLSRDGKVAGRFSVGTRPLVYWGQASSRVALYTPAERKLAVWNLNPLQRLAQAEAAPTALGISAIVLLEGNSVRYVEWAVQPTDDPNHPQPQVQEVLLQYETGGL